MLSTRIRTYIRQNVLGLVAIFIALSGTAYATHPGGQNTISSADIIDGEVKEADVGQGAVASAEVKNDSIVAGDVAPGSLGSSRIADASLTGVDVRNDTLTGADVAGLTGADLAPNSIPTGRITDETLTGADVKDNALKGADIDESTLSSIGGGGPAGGDLTGTYPNPQIAPDAVGTSEVTDESLTGADIASNTLNGFDIDESGLGKVPSAVLGGLGAGASPGGTCNPNSGVFITCTFTTINVPQTTRVLVIGTVQARPEVVNFEASGQCRLATNLGVLPNSLSSFNTGALDDEFVPLIGMVLVSSGSVDFGIECNDLDNIQYGDPRVVAVGLSPL